MGGPFILTSTIIITYPQAHWWPEQHQLQYEKADSLLLLFHHCNASCVNLDMHYTRITHSYHHHGVARWTASQQAEWLSCTWGMVHTKIHLINPGCPLAQYSLSVQLWPKTPFIHFHYHHHHYNNIIIVQNGWNSSISTSRLKYCQYQLILHIADRGVQKVLSYF